MISYLQIENLTKSFGDNLLFYLNSEVGVPCEMKLDGKTIYITLK